MAVQFLSSEWCIINAYTHTGVVQQTQSARLRSRVQSSGEAVCGRAGAAQQQSLCPSLRSLLYIAVGMYASRYETVFF